MKTGDEVEVSAPRNDKICWPWWAPALGTTRNGSCVIRCILVESFRSGNKLGPAVSPVRDSVGRSKMGCGAQKSNVTRPRRNSGTATVVLHALIALAAAGIPALGTQAQQAASTPAPAPVIVQPGAPGQPSHTLAAEYGSDFAAMDSCRREIHAGHDHAPRASRGDDRADRIAHRQQRPARVRRADQQFAIRRNPIYEALARRTARAAYRIHGRNAGDGHARPRDDHDDARHVDAGADGSVAQSQRRPVRSSFPGRG